MFFIKYNNYVIIIKGFIFEPKTEKIRSPIAHVIPIITAGINEKTTLKNKFFNVVFYLDITSFVAFILLSLYKTTSFITNFWIAEIKVSITL